MPLSARSAPITLWRHPDFLRLWAGQSISLVGSQITLLALPLTAVLVRHAITPNSLQGRVNATMSLIVGGPAIVDALAGGILGGLLGLWPVFAVAGVGTLVGGLWLYLSPVRSLIHAPDAAPPGQAS